MKNILLFDLVLILLLGLSVLAWCPWVTDEFSFRRINSSITPCEIGNSEGTIDLGSLSFKGPFGRKLTAIPATCPDNISVGTNQFFVSALGTVHKIGSTTKPNLSPTSAPGQRIKWSKSRNFLVSGLGQHTHSALRKGEQENTRLGRRLFCLYD